MLALTFLYLFFIAGVAFTYKISPMTFRAYFVGSFGIIFAIYFGGVTNYLVFGGSLSLETVALVTSFMLLPLIMMLGFRLSCPQLHVNQKSLASEFKVLIESLDNSIVWVKTTYFCLYGFVLIDMFSSGLFYRSYYNLVVESGNGLLFSAVYSAAFLITLNAWLNKKYLTYFFVVFTLILLGKKSPVLSVIVFPVLLSIFYMGTSFRKFVGVAIVSVGLFWVLAGFIYSSLEIPFLTQIASSFDYLKNFDYFVKYYPFGHSGGDILVTSFYKFWPRLFWEDKPVMYGFLLIHQYLFPEEAAMNFFPGLLTGFAVWLADFSYLGILLGVIFKFFLYLVLTLNFVSPKIRFMMVIYFFDPNLAFFIGVFFVIQYIPKFLIGAK